MSKLSFCQTGYPKKIVIDNDTVICITTRQLTIINHNHIELMECREKDSLNTSLLDLCERTVQSKDSLNHILDSEISAQKEVISTLQHEVDKIILRYNHQKDIYKENVRKQRKKTIIFVGISAIVGFLIGIFI